MKLKSLTVVFIFFAFFLYLFFIYDVNFHGPDEPIYFAYTASIVDDGDMNVINQLLSKYEQFNFDLSATYNLPDFHNHGGVVLWVPFYAYAKFIFVLANKIKLSSLAAYGLEKITKSMLSFSTVLFGFLAFLLSYLLCRTFFSGLISFLSTLVLFFGTPFFYYTLFETGNANIIASLFSLLSIWFCSYAISMKRWHWFLYGMLFSISVAIRSDLWFQIIFIFLFLILLRLSKQAILSNVAYFLSGFFIILTLRAANAFIKYGTLHIEELFYVSSFLRYKSTYNFDNLFNSFRGIFYTSPVLYICFFGLVLTVINLFKKNRDIIRKKQDIFLLVL